MPPRVPVTPSAEAQLYLRALKEEGIETLCLENPQSPPPSKNTPSSGTVLRKRTVPNSPNPNTAEWNPLRDEVLRCSRCPILVKNRTKIVFGSGNVKARLMFVGEAPGRDEDLQGLPFVGAAGQLLTKIIASIGLDRSEVYIANVLKCRPPNNRPPAPDEISNCTPYLDRQIALIQPQILCALGTFAAQTLLKTTTPISKLRGQFYPYGTAALLCTYHPAYLLRNPADKRKVWEDMKMIRARLDLE